MKEGSGSVPLTNGIRSESPKYFRIRNSLAVGSGKLNFPPGSINCGNNKSLILYYQTLLFVSFRLKKRNQYGSLLAPSVSSFFSLSDFLQR
jgi:hypothetical protein